MDAPVSKKTTAIVELMRSTAAAFLLRLTVLPLPPPLRSSTFHALLRVLVNLPTSRCQVPAFSPLPQAGDEATINCMSGRLEGRMERGTWKGRRGGRAEARHRVGVGVALKGMSRCAQEAMTCMNPTLAAPVSRQAKFDSRSERKKDCRPTAKSKCNALAIPRPARPKRTPRPPRKPSPGQRREPPLEKPSHLPS